MTTGKEKFGGKETRDLLGYSLLFFSGYLEIVGRSLAFEVVFSFFQFPISAQNLQESTSGVFKVLNLSLDLGFFLFSDVSNIFIPTKR